MSEVTDAPVAANANNAPSAHGNFIWYELMTPDADAAKAFYDAVVGWHIGEPVAEFQGYRMIGRSDGGICRRRASADRRDAAARRPARPGSAISASTMSTRRSPRSSRPAARP